MDKETALAIEFGKDWLWVIRLNSLYYALIDKGLLTENDFVAARKKSIDDMYENLTTRRQSSGEENQGLIKKDPMTWRNICFSPISRILHFFLRGR